MFTGIITHIGKVEKLELSANKDCLLAIAIAQPIARKLEIGCSIACNGICLTLIKQEDNLFYFQASNETRAKTTLNNWFVGQEINIEFALRFGDELGGHLVSGHVDGCAKLASLHPIQESTKMVFKLENHTRDLEKFIVKKGSICVDGISLTVNEVNGDEFSVNIIPHTIENTALKAIKIGNLVNIEIDLVARYINKWQN